MGVCFLWGGLFFFILTSSFFYFFCGFIFFLFCGFLGFFFFIFLGFFFFFFFWGFFFFFFVCILLAPSFLPVPSLSKMPPKDFIPHQLSSSFPSKFGDPFFPLSPLRAF